MNKEISTKKRKSCLKLENSPVVNSIGDLIEISKNVKFYKNLDNIMLWKITPYLEELNKMIGMQSLKETMFYQILYYLQGMHTRNKSGEYLHTMIFGEPGSGKCLGKDTPVIMYDCTIKMVQDIKKGDKIMGDDSKERNVLSVCSGREIMYKIKQEYGDDYIVNQSHILSLKLIKNPEISDNKNSFTVKWFTKEKINIKIFKYISKEKDIVYEKVFNFYSKLSKTGLIVDINILDYLKRSRNWKRAFNGFKVCINFKKIDVELDPYQVGLQLGNKVLKKIPDEYKMNSMEVRLEVLKGLVDCSGYIKIEKENETLAKDILFLVRSIGFKCVINIDKDNYNIKVNKIDNLIYKIEVEKLSEDDYYGFTIDGNNRFLLGDFTVTHNTSVARIIAKIYQSMGVLSENGPFIVAHRDDFIAGYLGQTSIKTRKLLDSCKGGVLFVDEVYSLCARNSDKDIFSDEAIETIIPFLSEEKNFCFIGAGYEDEIIKRFFSKNKGLERRFQWIHKIEKYSATDLADIMIKMIFDMKWKCSIDKSDIINILKDSIKLFKNAGGDIEIFLSKCKMIHSKRVFMLDNEHKFVLTKKDFEDTLNVFKKSKLKKDLNDGPNNMYI